jgi:hypothetical protein
MFDSNLYEHGAGGSVGAYFYSGLPFSHSADRDFPNRGILRDWLGPLGTILLSLSLLLGGAIYHIRWQFNRGVKIGSVIPLLKRTFLKERKTSNLNRIRSLMKRNQVKLKLLLLRDPSSNLIGFLGRERKIYCLRMFL